VGFAIYFKFKFAPEGFARLLELLNC